MIHATRRRTPLALVVAVLAFAMVMVLGTGTAAAMGGMKGSWDATPNATAGTCSIGVDVTWPKPKRGQYSLAYYLWGPGRNTPIYSDSTAVTAGVSDNWSSSHYTATYSTPGGTWQATVELYNANGKILAYWTGYDALPCTIP